MPAMCQRSMVGCTEPVDLKSVNAGQDSLSHDPPANQIVIEFISIKNPKITCVGYKVESSRSKLEPSAHPLALALGIPQHQTHLAPQKAKTFRT